MFLTQRKRKQTKGRWCVKTKESFSRTYMYAQIFGERVSGCCKAKIFLDLSHLTGELISGYGRRVQPYCDSSQATGSVWSAKNST